MKSYNEAVIAGIIALVIAFALVASGLGGYASLVMIAAIALFIVAVVHKYEDRKKKEQEKEY
jgi:hypothetical protein